MDTGAGIVPTALYCDGGVIMRNPSPYGLTWAAVLVYKGDDSMEYTRRRSGCFVSTVLLGGKATNNQAEYYAMLMGLSGLPDGWSGPIYTDSQITLGRFFLGWATNGIPDDWVRRANHELLRIGGWEPILLGGHPTKADLLRGCRMDGMPVSKWNVLCDQLCRDQAAAYLVTRMKEVGHG
jgi:ribonuclease HI